MAEIADAYLLHARRGNAKQASDTLVTKVTLSTFGCLPAFDRYFVAGAQAHGLGATKPNQATIGRLHAFCRENLDPLRREQARIFAVGGIRYPLIKLVDMYFLQRGAGAAGSSSGRDSK